jgi:hypothetical protein
MFGSPKPSFLSRFQGTGFCHPDVVLEIRSGADHWLVTQAKLRERRTPKRTDNGPVGGSISLGSLHFMIVISKDERIEDHGKQEGLSDQIVG